jgi:cell division protein ZapA
MSNEAMTVSVQILDKEFRIACPEEEHDALLASAHLINTKMKEMRARGIVGQDRIAIMAALNIAHELLQQQNKSQTYASSMSSRIQNLQSRIENALTKNKQLEL